MPIQLDQLANVCVDINEAKNLSEDHQSIADIKKFATDPESAFMLDVQSDNLPDIIDEVLLHLIAENQLPFTQINDNIRSAFLTDEASPKLRNTFRDIEDSNWLVAHGEVKDLPERLIVFVRLANTTN